MFIILMRAMMGFSWVFVVYNLFLACDGFLLDDRTNPATTPGPLLTDQHYNALISLIMNERQARTKLEQHVVHLEKELLATQQGVTDIYHTSTNNNATLEQQTKNWNALYAKYNGLVNDNTLIKSNFDALRMNHSNLEIYTKLLEQEVSSLQQLKGVTDLQTVLNMRNETNVLRKELKMTNDSLKTVRNEAEARKQDFVALLKMAESTKTKLEFSVEAFQYQQNHSKLEMKLLQDEVQKMGTYQNQTYKHLHENLTAVEGVQNLSVGKLDLEIHNMSNRAAFTVCTKGQLFTRGSIITFPNIQTRYGVRNSALSDFGKSGKFRCEKAGLYLISGYIMIETSGTVRLYFYNNDKRIVLLYFTSNAHSTFQTGSILTLQYLNIHDTLYIKAGDDALIAGGEPYSCISLIQLTSG